MRAPALPVLTWARGYRRTWVRGDLLAGLTITAYLVPQVMANAELARLAPAVGLWTAVGALVGYALVGSSRLVSMGPESACSIMAAAALQGVSPERRPAFAAALALAVAAFCVLGWLGRLSAVADLLSRPVLVGYMAGIAAIMIVSQLGNLAGFPVDADGFLREAWYFLRHLGDTHGSTLSLGLGTLALLLLAAWRFPRAPVALAGMLGATLVATLLHLKDHGVAVVGHIPARLPDLGVPSLPWHDVLHLLAPAVGIAFVAFTDTILTGRAFAGSEERPDARRELLSVGIANLGAGLMHGFPVSSSGSRTAIGKAVGGRTQLTGLITAAITVVAVFAARPVLEAFPAAALGAVVVYAAVRLVEVGEFRRFWHFRRSEFVLAAGTTVAVLAVGVLYGVLVAIGLSVLDLLRRVARPHDAVLGFVPGLAGMHDLHDFPSATDVPGLVVYRYDSPLFFANAENFRTRALAAVAEQEALDGRVHWFVLNTEAMVEIDVTGADALEALRVELDDRGIVLGLARLKQDLREALVPTGLLDRIGEQHIFATLPTAVDAFRAAYP
jgi:SulP family sulfate permease